MFYERSEDYRPLFWLQGRPIYVTTLIVLLNILAFILTALAIFAFNAGIVEWLVLSTADVLHGQIWRLISYIIFIPSDGWSAVYFIFAMGFFYHFSRQVEEFIGRKVFSILFASLVLIPALALCLIGLFWPQGYLGGYGIIFGMFIAFATIYPGVVINIWFVNLTAKGWAFALLGVVTLAYFAYHDWIGLGGTWLDAAIAYLGLRSIGAGRGLTWLSDWLEDRRAQRLARQRNIKLVRDKEVSDSIDAILEKISKQGVGSLNAAERAALERARTNLLKRDQR